MEQIKKEGRKEQICLLRGRERHYLDLLLIMEFGLGLVTRAARIISFGVAEILGRRLVSSFQPKSGVASSEAHFLLILLVKFAF